jgi:hypothetical protein
MLLLIRYLAKDEGILEIVFNRKPAKTPPEDIKCLQRKALMVTSPLAGENPVTP